MTAFVDPLSNFLIELEAAANYYNVLPYEGGLLDQPQYILDAFKIIRRSDNIYQIKKAEKDKKAAELEARKTAQKRKL